MSKSELFKIGSFPSDYKFGRVGHNYCIGMSVPPTMAAQISYRIYEQWITKLK